MEQRNGFNSEETTRKQGEAAEITVKYDGKNDKVEQSKVDAMRNFAQNHDPSVKVLILTSAFIFEPIPVRSSVVITCNH